jgi:hypothetical protein
MSDHAIEVMLVEIASRLDELAEKELRAILARQDHIDSRLRVIEDGTGGLRHEVRGGREDIAALRQEVELMRRDLGRLRREVAALDDDGELYA